MKTFNIIVFALVVATLAVSGCFSSNPKDLEAFLKPQQVTATQEYYILMPPDEITTSCATVPELNLQIQQIRPDGKISFENLGEIAVAGKTPAEATEIIKTKASTLYTLTGEKPIDVRVTKFRSHVYYVLGQVNFPGPRVCTGTDTVLTALESAQPTVLGWESRIQIVRPSTDPNVPPKIFEFNRDKCIAHGDAQKNVLLSEGDIVFVPPTVLAGIAMKVEEFVRPIGRAFSTVNVVQGPSQ